MMTKNDQQSDEQEMSLQESLRELKDIVSWFDDQDEVDVEKGLAKVKEGVKLIHASRKRFAELENEFTNVKEELEETE